MDDPQAQSSENQALQPAPEALFLPRADLQVLLDLLKRRGYTVIGPRVDQGAIVYDQIASVDELPRGWTDEQQPGSYRLRRREDEKLFGYAVGPHSWKRFLFPAEISVARARRQATGWEMEDVEHKVPKYAFLGVRACELAAIAVQDRTFLGEHYSDPIYADRRRQALFIGVNCTQAASTCFCTSMNTGPRCTSGFDLALTEVEAGFTLEIGSERGQQLAGELPLRPPEPKELQQAASGRQEAVDQITKQLDTTDIRDLLLGNLDHPRWNEVASRCLSCTNCTMVCPTCFCSSVREVSDLDVTQVERQRVWDSCFNVDFSYMNGGIVRNQIRPRYRQWLTHKLASWIDQFGLSGCVGCGRCITWCPVGIDLTEEVAAIRGGDS